MGKIISIRRQRRSKTPAEPPADAPKEPAENTAPLVPLAKDRQCAWCNLIYGNGPHHGENPGHKVIRSDASGLHEHETEAAPANMSHGICPDCADRLKASQDARRDAAKSGKLLDATAKLDERRARKELESALTPAGKRKRRAEAAVNKIYAQMPRDAATLHPGEMAGQEAAAARHITNEVQRARFLKRLQESKAHDAYLYYPLGSQVPAVWYNGKRYRLDDFNGGGEPS